jgi:hypothetical protein
MPRRVHLVGSVPCSDEEEVFTIVSRELGPFVQRIPDGETGERAAALKKAGLEDKRDYTVLEAPCPHIWQRQPTANEWR